MIPNTSYVKMFILFIGGVPGGPRTLKKRRLTRGGIRKESLADHFAEHIFMKDKGDVFMALFKEIQYV